MNSLTTPQDKFKQLAKQQAVCKGAAAFIEKAIEDANSMPVRVDVLHIDGVTVEEVDRVLKEYAALGWDVHSHHGHMNVVRIPGRTGPSLDPCDYTLLRLDLRPHCTGYQVKAEQG